METSHVMFFPMPWVILHTSYAGLLGDFLSSTIHEMCPIGITLLLSYVGFVQSWWPISYMRAQSCSCKWWKKSGLLHGIQRDLKLPVLMLHESPFLVHGQYSFVVISTEGKLKYLSIIKIISPSPSYLFPRNVHFVFVITL